MCACHANTPNKDVMSGDMHAKPSVTQVLSIVLILFPSANVELFIFNRFSLLSVECFSSHSPASNYIVIKC